MRTPLVSVVMPVFNCVRYLPQAVESILNQTWIDFEFIIINDGSTDGSAAVLDMYERYDPRVRVDHQPNGGIVCAMNRGCAAARGRYIARMDADDVALPGRLQQQIKVLEKAPDIGLIGSAVNFIDSAGQVIRPVKVPTGDNAIRLALLYANVFFHPTVVFRRDLFDSVGGYRDVGQAEDYDLWLRFAERARLANLAETTVHYRLHSEQLSVRKCEQQALGAAAASAAARARQRGEKDPLLGSGAITPEFVSSIGVSVAAQHTELARTYLACIRNMVDIGCHALALEALERLQFRKFGMAARWVIADLYLQAARLSWHQGNVQGTAVSAWRALATRPVLVGRPLKRWAGVTLERHGGSAGREFVERLSHPHARATGKSA